MLINLFKILVIFSFFSSCAQNDLQINTEDSVQEVFVLNTKAQIVNKKNQESHNVQIKITTLANKATRLDLTAFMGYRVAELTMTSERIQCLNREEKIFTQGKFEDITMKALFGQKIDPQLIWKIAHGKKIKSGQYGFLQASVEPIESALNRFQSFKLILENEAFKIIWLIKDKEILEKIPTYNETFVLSKPTDFKEIRLK